jgi:hypothetical protein
MWMLALVLCGCHQSMDSGNTGPAGRAESVNADQSLEQSANMKTQASAPSVKRLIVSKTNNAGRLVQIGTVNFDESRRASLSTEGSGSVVDELKRVWEQISQQPKLKWVHSRTDTAHGGDVTQIVGEDSSPGDGKYFYAVMDTLARKYGYVVDIAK